MKWCVVLVVACYQPRTLTGADASIPGPGSDAVSMIDAPADAVSASGDAACTPLTWSVFDAMDPTTEDTNPPDGIDDWVDNPGFNFASVAGGVWTATSAGALTTNPPESGSLATLHASMDVGLTGVSDGQAFVLIQMSHGAKSTELRIDVQSSHSGSEEDFSATDAFGVNEFFSRSDQPLGRQTVTIDVADQLATVSIGGQSSMTLLAPRNGALPTEVSIGTDTGGMQVANVTITTCQ